LPTSGALGIVEALGDISQSTVLEIGPGRGVLTSLLARRTRPSLPSNSTGYWLPNSA